MIRSALRPSRGALGVPTGPGRGGRRETRSRAGVRLLGLISTASVRGGVSPRGRILGARSTLSRRVPSPLFQTCRRSLAAIPRIYRIVTPPTLPTIPLFGFAGYVLTVGNVSRRLVRFFRAVVGWMPGGIAVVTVLVCTFFTTFTGASGVTIVALGGILLPALLVERYPERFSLGLLTASGSLGLLFPPCLPVILYGVVAGIAVDKMFLGGFLPGVLLSLIMAGWAVRGGVRAGARRHLPWKNWARRVGGEGDFFSVIVLVGIRGGRPPRRGGGDDGPLRHRHRGVRAPRRGIPAALCPKRGRKPPGSSGVPPPPRGGHGPDGVPWSTAGFPRYFSNGSVDDRLPFTFLRS